MSALGIRNGRVTNGTTIVNKSRRIHKKDKHEQKRKKRQKNIKKAKLRAKVLAKQPKVSTKKGVARSASAKSRDTIDAIDRSAWGLQAEGGDDGQA